MMKNKMTKKDIRRFAYEELDLHSKENEKTTMEVVGAKVKAEYTKRSVSSKMV